MQEGKLLFKWKPLRDVGSSHKPKVKVARFGDGYEQRSKDGINSCLKSMSLKFRKRDAEIDQIDSFLQERAGVESFYYIHKDGVPRLYVCDDWNRVDIDYRTSEISATFREVVN